MLHYLKIWLASARYSVVRTLMFRFDFFLWSMVELVWMAVNVLAIEVIYGQTDSVAGWSKYQMLLLIGTAMLIQRFVMGFFWSSIFELSRNVRTGNFDFFLAQPGNLMFMATTRKLDFDSLANSVVALAIIGYSAHRLHLVISPVTLLLYASMIVSGIVIHYSILTATMAMVFWMTNAQGVEGSYFTLTEFSRLPREAFKGFVTKCLFVWLLPVVVVSNVPANTLLRGFDPLFALWLFIAAVVWFVFAVFIFHRGLKRYSSASS